MRDRDRRGRPRILRTLVNRALLGGIGAAVLAVSAILLVADDAGPAVADGTGSVRDLRLRRPARRRSCSCCGSSPPSPGTARRERRRPDRGRVTASAEGRATAGRALLPPSGRRRPPRRLGRRRAAPPAVPGGRHGDERRRARRPRRGRHRRADRRPPAPPRGGADRRGRHRRRPRRGVGVAAPLAAAGDGDGARRRWAPRHGGWSSGLLDEPARLPGSLAGDSWLLSSRFPSPGALAGAFAALTVG